MPERDRQVLLRIADHRYLSTHQIQGFDFQGHGSLDSAATTTRRVLRRLGRLGLVKALDRRVGGSRRGSAVNIWQITPPAARLLRDDGAAWRSHEPSPRFLQHCLVVADVHLTLRALQDQPSIQNITVQLEPAAWRRHTGLGGEPRWLQPDLAATVTTSEWVDSWFIEVDLGTESLPTLLRKCGQYETYRASGIEQLESGVFPLVLWFFTKPERAQRLQQAVVRSPRLTPALYRYAQPDTLSRVLLEASV
ncbi:MAG: replication-relaxation family protein [Candidatus Neomicrothrix subdominans]